MNMKIQLVRGMLALVMFAGVGGWALTHRAVVAKPSALRVAMREPHTAEVTVLIEWQRLSPSLR